MRSSRVYESIHTVKNMYNDFIILRAFFLREKICCVRISNWNLVVFVIYSNFLYGKPLSTKMQKTRALTGSNFGIYHRLISGLKTK